MLHSRNAASCGSNESKNPGSHLGRRKESETSSAPIDIGGLMLTA
jgi:hypothetical protein